MPGELIDYPIATTMAQPMVQRPKRLQLSNGVFYWYEKGQFYPQDGSDAHIGLVQIAEQVKSPQDHVALTRLMSGELESVPASVIQFEAKEAHARQVKRQAGVEDSPTTPPVQAVRELTPLASRKAVGSRWMFYPKLAGYADVWPPGPCTIVQPLDPEPLKPGSPPRDYLVTRDGGVNCYASEASLVGMETLPSQEAVSIEERSKLNRLAPAQTTPNGGGRKAVGSECLFKPELAGSPGGRPSLCRIVEVLEPTTLKPGTPPRDYRVVTSGGGYCFASEASLTSLQEPT